MTSKAIVFEFTSYKFEPNKKRVVFNYKTKFKNGKSISFSETVILPKTPNKIDKDLQKKMLESLHLVLGISYYKLYCATKVLIPYKLSRNEADLWNTIYKKGLGEFFYINNLDPAISPKFPFHKNINQKNFSTKKSGRCLVGIGGGKDSVVALELLEEGKFDVTGLLIKTNEESDIALNVAKTAKVNTLIIKRVLDSKIFNAHLYSGHIPISAIYAFLGYFASALYNYSYFIVGNEYSSNFGNVDYKGLTINHQWSKSFEFEKLFEDYSIKNLSSDIKYFSLLRSFYEIRITKLFSNYKKYLNVFSSCNNNFKKTKIHEGLWCNNCPKCVFTFTMLSAFLRKEELINIFGQNLYEKQNLLPLFKDILGLGQMKPFDCVGTFEESQTALFMASEQHKDSFIIKQLFSLIRKSDIVFKAQAESNVPEKFRFLGMESVLIMGYGKEGQINEQYIKKYYPKIKIKIADEKLSPNYLENQENYDIAIKTAGMRKELVKIPYTTATNIFFSEVLGKNIIIGITGSKGKSTTSSLIYQILKEAKRDVEFLGNIGNPMLKTLLSPLKKGKIFVLELSSYQLSDIKYSPDIALVTNLFGEHMDYHGNYKNYYEAKKNIINFQNENGWFIYNPSNKISLSWLKGYKAKKIPFAKEILVKENEIHLIGKHNIDNIKAAISVAKILNIKESAIKSAIKKFRGLPHRLEFVGEFKGIKFYDDAISTTPESTIEAIKSIKGIDTIFLGGQDRGYDFSDLEKTIKKYRIKNVVLFPDSGEKIIRDKKYFNVLETRSMEEAVEFAYLKTKKGGVCLLSCASPSYSVWKNFEEKGDEFKKFVNNLSKK